MPDGLNPRATVLLVAVAFGLTFSVQAVLGGGSSPARPAEPKQNASASTAAEPPAAKPDLQLAAGTVPALREPRKARKRRVRKRKRAVRRFVRVAPRVQPRPVMPAATPKPAPTAAPRYIPPAPRYIPPAPRTPAPRPQTVAPQRTPPPAPTPPTSGEFDTTGER